MLLIGDDHGYPYYGFMGDENVVTPSMDALAAGGVTFSHGHVTASYCRPSLRTLITGLHPVQYVLRKAEILDRRRREDAEYSSLDSPTGEKRRWDVIETAAAMREFDTLPKLLGDAGYVSWQGGKWWENTYENGHFTQGMSTGWDMSTYEGDTFFEELMGGKGKDLVRKTMDPVFDFIDRHREAAIPRVVRPVPAACALRCALYLPQVLRGPRTLPNRPSSITPTSPGGMTASVG